MTGTAIDVPADEPQNGSEPAPKGNREARYRVERNEARDQLSAANARIERMQRAEVQRLASDGLSHPEDLFSLSGNDVADYLTETGDIDAAKVAADVAEILAERPGLRKNAPAFDPSQGRGGKTPPPQREPSWSDLLKS
ncbi:MAG: hypothetical protein JST91_28205 [Actinobacteria bacterium]|nr:hypothetical protein [Actinomycetota bacterium]